MLNNQEIWNGFWNERYPTSTIFHYNKKIYISSEKLPYFSGHLNLMKKQIYLIHECQNLWIK